MNDDLVEALQRTARGARGRSGLAEARTIMYAAADEIARLKRELAEARDSLDRATMDTILDVTRTLCFVALERGEARAEVARLRNALEELLRADELPPDAESGRRQVEAMSKAREALGEEK